MRGVKHVSCRCGMLRDMDGTGVYEGFEHGMHRLSFLV